MDASLAGYWWVPPVLAVVAGVTAWLVIRWRRRG